MNETNLSRRTVLKGEAATLASLSVLQVAGPAHAFTGRVVDGDNIAADDRQLDPANIGPSGDVLPWEDQPDPVPPPAQSVVGNLLEWEALNTF